MTRSRAVLLVTALALAGTALTVIGAQPTGAGALDPYRIVRSIEVDLPNDEVSYLGVMLDSAGELWTWEPAPGCTTYSCTHRIRYLGGRLVEVDADFIGTGGIIVGRALDGSVWEIDVGCHRDGGCTYSPFRSLGGVGVKPVVRAIEGQNSNCAFVGVLALDRSAWGRIFCLNSNGSPWAAYGGQGVQLAVQYPVARLYMRDPSGQVWQRGLGFGASWIPTGGRIRDLSAVGTTEEPYQLCGIGDDTALWCFNWVNAQWHSFGGRWKTLRPSYKLASMVGTAPDNTIWSFTFGGSFRNWPGGADDVSSARSSTILVVGNGSLWINLGSGWDGPH